MSAQECNLRMKGKVFDDASRTPLEFVNVFIQEVSDGAVTDINGDFILTGLCQGEYHLNISHIGCEAKIIRIDLLRDTVIDISMEHSPHVLDAVVVEGEDGEFRNQARQSVNRQEIADNTNLNLAGLLENQSGVHLIKNGSGISKPVVQGLYGNRLTILNNGIAQSGQQWGNDHTPEIDPYAADKIVVLKGASSIEYGNLGSAVLVEPKPIEKEDHLHGEINYAFESNGRGNVLNARLEQYTSAFGWRLNGTIKKYGDRRAPNYFLNNTGSEEANLALQIEKSWKAKTFFKFYASTFNTTLGILRGSNIGNTTDLEEVLIRDVPFFTEPVFNYAIANPRQDVSHQLVKGEVKHFLKDHQVLDITLAGQLNNRKEFDVRRGDRDDKPTLSLRQYTFNGEAKYTNDLSEFWTMKLGLQNTITDNTNDPVTGILPLIPDYLSWRNGIFGTLNLVKDEFELDFGLRYEYEFQDVAAISTSASREILRFENKFHTLSGLVSAKFNISEKQNLSLNIGYAMRAPGINERYSNGLHQGVSGIELGDPSLTTERSIKNTIEYKWVPNNNFSISSLFYFQHFQDYIFLAPQDELRLTIRGAFPVFEYSQTDANIYGVDLSTQFTISNTVLGIIRYSYIRGQDTTKDVPLVFIPPNSLYSKLLHRVKKTYKLTPNVKLDGLELEASSRVVFEQTHLLSEQDFVAPPPMYHLLGAKISANIITPKYQIRVYAKADNLLNTSYRDYLNRLRYFSDEPGRSITVGLNFKF